MLNQAIYLVTEVCTYCSQASVNLEAVSCFEESCTGAAETEKLNKKGPCRGGHSHQTRS
jgi:hypothetical protein